MENKEFIIEPVKRLLPDTSWGGESNHDRKSVENIEIVKEIVYLVLDNLLGSMFVVKGYEGNDSCVKISKAKQEAFKEILDYYDLDIQKINEVFYNE